MERMVTPMAPGVHEGTNNVLTTSHKATLALTLAQRQAHA